MPLLEHTVHRLMFQENLAFGMGELDLVVITKMYLVIASNLIEKLKM